MKSVWFNLVFRFYNNPFFRQLRAQIYAYKLLSRNQPLTEHVVQALHGKRVLMAPGSGK